MIDVWACPDCGADLHPDGWCEPCEQLWTWPDGWCEPCEQLWTWPAITADDPPEYQHPEGDDE